MSDDWQMIFGGFMKDLAFVLFGVLAISLGNCSPSPHNTHVTIDGTLFRINGDLTYADLSVEAQGRLMNARMVNSTFEDLNPVTAPEGFDPDLNTTAFIESMAEYQSKGILAFTLNLQGGMPGYEGALNSAFLRNGFLKPDYLSRISRVIEAADDRGMVIILGFFYQRQDQILRDEEAVKLATTNAAAWLKKMAYRNVLVEISNEYRHPGFDHPILLTEDGQVKLMELVRAEAPELLVSTSGMGDARFHETLAQSADFILIHGNTSEPEDYPARIAELQRFGKPIVFNEDWCFSDDSRGVPDAVAKLRTSYAAGASWGIMNQKRNQTYPFQFGIGRPDGASNAQEDFRVYQELTRLLGIQ
jgi:hypothetical protein